MAKETFDEMMRVVKCRHCGGFEYYGEMRYLNGRCECRKCYKHHREEIDHEPYGYTDLEGKCPTEKDFLEQEDEICAACGGNNCAGCEHQHERRQP